MPLLHKSILFSKYQYNYIDFIIITNINIYTSLFINTLGYKYINYLIESY